MHNLINDVSVLTTIPAPALTRLQEKSIWCICNSLEEEKLAGNNLTEINIGIGTLQILVDNNEMKYRFIPSKALENSAKATLTEGKNPLTATVEATLVRRILNTYKNYV